MIAVTRNGKIAVLTLAKGNANTLDIEFCRALTGQLNELKKSPVEAVVITAEGPIFSAGVDLLRASKGGAKYLRPFLPVLNKMFDAAFFFPKPLIAAVNGHAIAGGCVLAACADYRLMARGNSRIGVTELLVGLPFPALAFEVMRFVTSPRYFAEVIYTGETYLPDAGLDRGLVHGVVEPQALRDRALQAAGLLAELSPAAFSLTKQQMRLGVAERMKRDGKRIDAAATKAWTSPKTVASIDAYVARTFKQKR